MTRHRLSIKKPQAVEIARKKAADPFILQEFYDIVEKVIKELGLENKPERIYNIDETSYCSDPQKTKVVGLKGFPSTRTTSSAGKTNTTVLIASNAAGGKGPPIIIFKGKHVWSGWTSDEAYPGTLYTATSNGWIESEAFAEFMAKSFIPMVKHETEPALLIYDGHSTHVQLAVIEMAKQNNITIIKLPPHTSHLLQPLDLSVFKPYKDAWDQEMVKWQRTHKGEKLPKDQFSATVGRVWKNLNSNVIKKGFEKSGIYPFNRNAVPEHKLDPEALKRWKKHHENLSEEQTLACSSPITLAKLCLNKINACMTCIKLSIPVTILPNDKISSKNIFSEHFELPISSKSSEKISFEDLLIQSTKKSQTGNVKQKKVKISASAEVITHEDVIERLRQKENDKAKKEEEKEEKRKQREQKQKDRLNKQNEKNDKVKNFDEKSKTNMRMTKNKQSQVADPPSSETALSELIPFNSDLNFRDPIHHLQDDSSIPNCLASSSESPLPIPSKPKIAILEDRYLKVDEKLTKEVFTGHKMKRPADFTLQGTEEKNINKKIEQEGRNNPKKIQTRKREKKQKKTKIEEDLEDDSDFTFMIQMVQIWT
uniref:SFRICE_041149 n=1 Tax=Spodoptera frugiperda TaxID=7108 RepID=A0A2H1WZ62_SPOFR